MKNKNLIIIFSVLVAILNLFDGVFTSLGLLHNLIEELNPLMEELWENGSMLFLLVKILLSTSLIIISFFVYKKSKPRFQSIFLLLLVGAFFIYAGVFGLHVYWISII